jgi:hypothetical protein
MKLINFIICDDIRQEVGNKLSLMGVYSDSINFQSVADKDGQWPRTKRIGLYVLIETEEREQLKDIQSFEIEIDYNGEVQKIGGSDVPPPNLKTQKGVAIQAIFERFKFKEPGTICFSIQFFNKNGEKLFDARSPNPLKVEETILPIKS